MTDVRPSEMKENLDVPHLSANYMEVAAGVMIEGTTVTKI